MNEGQEKEVSLKKSNTVLLTILAVATLLVAVVGATFAYFSVTVSGNDSASSVIVQTAQLGLVYTDGNEINAQNIIPGWTATKTFTVENSGDVAMEYDIVWSDLTNSFTQGELKYSIAGAADTGTAGTLAETAVPTTAGDIITAVTVEPGATHTYTVTLSFPDTSSAQNYNQGQTFAGKIEVTAENIGG